MAKNEKMLTELDKDGADDFQKNIGEYLKAQDPGLLAMVREKRALDEVIKARARKVLVEYVKMVKRKQDERIEKAEATG